MTVVVRVCAYASNAICYQLDIKKGIKPANLTAAHGSVYPVQDGGS